MSTTRIMDDSTLGGRDWEEFYRNRWQYDKVVRSAHGVNCTGACSWMVHVKDGIVGWELQANDYPQFNGDLPNHEPRAVPVGSAFPGISTALCGSSIPTCAEYCLISGLRPESVSATRLKRGKALWRALKHGKAIPANGVWVDSGAHPGRLQRN